MAKVKGRQTQWQWLLRIPQRFWSSFCLPCLRFLNQALRFLGWQLRHNLVVTLVLLFTLLLAGVCLLNFLPFVVPFEGSLTVSEIGFTTTRAGQLLLKDIRGIQEIMLSGHQTIPLEGTSFSSKDEPRLNGSGRRNIELLDGGYWTIASTNRKASQLNLSELTLSTETRIRELKYSPYNRALWLTLKPDANPPGGDRSFLKIGSGSDRLQITLGEYRLPDLNRQDSNPLTFTFNTTGLDLPFTESLTLRIQLSEVGSQPFWRDIDVKDVRLEKQVQKGDDSNANVVESTILSGTISMVERQLNLKKGQFLLVDPPAIQNLASLQIVYPDASKKPEDQKSSQITPPEEPANGLTVAISGNTPRIQAGLNKRLPVPPKLQGSILSRHLSSDAIVALLSFCGGLVASLLMWLVSNTSKSNSNS